MRSRLLLALLLAPLPAQAQVMGVIEDLFSTVNSITFYTQVGALTDNTDLEGTVLDFGVAGIGTEVLLDLPSSLGTDFELGLGAGVVRGFQAAEPSLDLHGSIRTLPQIAIYASGFGHTEQRALNPYVGVTFGFSDLWNARGYDAGGAVYKVNAETFEIGFTGGLYVEAPMLKGLFVEAGYRLRRFESLAWDTDVLPEGWPRAVDASLVFVNVGWQFRLRAEEGDGA